MLLTITFLSTNMLKSDIFTCQKQNKISGEGHGPSPDPAPLGRGTSPSPNLFPSRRLRRLGESPSATRCIQLPLLFPTTLTPVCNKHVRIILGEDFGIWAGGCRSPCCFRFCIFN